MRVIIFILIFFISTIFADSNIDRKSEHIVVKITDNMPYIYTKDSGKTIKVQRIPDTSNRLTDDTQNIKVHGPPFWIQPTK